MQVFYFIDWLIVVDFHLISLRLGAPIKKWHADKVIYVIKMIYFYKYKVDWHRFFIASDIFWNATDYKTAKQWLIFDLAGMYSYLDRLFIQVICGN